MSRLPRPGGDESDWGSILNDFLEQAHEPDGSLKPVPQEKIPGLQQSLAGKAALADVEPAVLAADPAFTSRYGAFRLVTAYGALGDGVTDDAPAIQACIDASLPGEVVYFPATGAAPASGTTYLVGTDLLLKGGRAYVGPIAPNGTVGVAITYRSGTNGTAVLTSAAYATNATTAEAPIRIDNLRINGNKAGNTTGHGILLMNHNSQITHVYVSSTAQAGIVISDVNAAGALIQGTLVEVRIEACNIFSPGTYGIWVLDTSDAGKITDGFCRENIVSFASDYAIYIQRAAGWFVIDNHVYSCLTDGIRLQGAWNTYVIGNEVDGFAASGSVVTGVGINVDGILTGRPIAVAHNIVSANEALHPANTYIYYRFKNQSSTENTFVQSIDNKAHQDSTGGAASTGMSLQPNGSIMRFYESGGLMEGMPTTIGAPGTVHRMDLCGRVQGFIETIPRDAIDPTSGSPSPSAGTLALTYFTADQTMIVSKLTSATRGTAQAGATLARMALFAIDPASGNGNAIATTTSDRTMWQATSTAYTKPISGNGQGGSISSLKLIQGQRYAVGLLHVGSTTAPTLAGKGGIAGLIGGSGPTTRKGGYLSGQSDIPTSFLGTTINANNASGNYYYARLT